ncbi:MAG: hypothetical protein GX638_19440 [Crenarchaeota archaeon]|nr:hypothetical protein [Thermoproteota archaeon]
MNEINKQLKDLENQLSKLEERRQKLLLAQQEAEERRAKLDDLIKNSGYPDAKSLVEDLINKFGIRVSGGEAAEKSGRKPRIEMSAQIRDAIRTDLATNMKKSKIAKKHFVSYAVVTKVEKGAYNHL